MITDGEDDEQAEIELDDGDLDTERVAKSEGEDGGTTVDDVNDDLDGELVAEIDGEEEAEAEGETEAKKTLANRLRRLLRDSEREKLAIRRENEALKTTQAPKPVEIGKKPDRWDDDFESDEAYDEALRAYDRRVADVEAQKQAQDDAKEAAQQRVANAVQAMRAKAAAVGLKNYDEAELVVQKTLAPSLAEAIPILLGDQAAPLVQILHNNPQLIEKINKAVADDPQLGLAQGLVELTRLSMRIKMPVPRKSGAKPEEILRGSAPLSGGGSVDKKLEQLEAKAAKNGGDRSEIIAYKAEQRKKAA